MKIDKSKIRLIALDLDGTTFNSKKEITEPTKAAIARAIGEGILVMPCTGRSLSALPAAFTDIPGVRYALTSNGAAIWDLTEGICMVDRPIPHEYAVMLMEEILRHGTLADFFYKGKIYADQKGYDYVISEESGFADWFKTYVPQSRIPVEDLLDWMKSEKIAPEKITMSFDDLNQREHVLKALSVYDGAAIAFGNEFNIELTDSKVTKGSSLLAFAESLGIRQEEVMACGDMPNDRTVIEAAGFSVAMGNAHPEILLLADYVTLSNDEDGVAYVIGKLLDEGITL